jgi:hypothetical protein
MKEFLRGRQMLFLWACVLLGPIAWSLSLVSMSWLTHPVCQGARHGVLWVTGGICAVLAIVASVSALIGLARAGFPPEGSGVAPFLLRMALGLSAIFALVILLSMVPIGILSPCPV